MELYKYQGDGATFFDLCPQKIRRFILKISEKWLKSK